MAVRYKVVSIDQNYGIPALENREPKRFSALVKGFFKINYSKGKTVRAKKNTVGIMCFKRRHQAEAWMNGPTLYSEISDFEIIRVQPVGRGKTPKTFSGHYGTHVLLLLRKLIKRFGVEEGYKQLLTGRYDVLDMYVRYMEPPEGTICYPAVKVLD